MRFHIENDVRNNIVGWLAPDNPLAIARVAVALDGRRVGEVAATEPMPDLKAWGWHSTGICGFHANEAAVPGITEAARVELYDADTNTLLYRRPLRDDLLQARIVLVNPSIEATTAVQHALFPHFQMSYFSVERMPEETLICIVNGLMTSLLVAGTIPYARYEGFFYKNGFTTGIVVGDAHLELARRILWLRGRARLAAAPDQAWRTHELRGPIAFADALPLEDVNGLRKAFRSVEQDVWNFLSSPLTRTLACKLPNERLEAFHPSQALEALSRFHVVGHEAFFDAYAATVFAKVGIADAVAEAPSASPEAEALAETLRRVQTTRALIDYDVVLGDAVRGIVAQQWAGV